MFSFLRKIRLGLLKNDTTTRYLLYAIGEIALIVIGVLIALGINYWNNQRLDRIDEIKLLTALVDEMEDNKGYFQSMKNVEERKFNSALKLSKYFGDPPQKLSVDSFYKWSWYFSDIPPYSPKTAILSSTLASNKLDLITSDSIKYLLTDYHSRIVQLGGDFDYGRELWKNTILRFEVANLSVANQYQIRIGNDVSGSAFDWNMNNVLSSKEYENIVMKFMMFDQNLARKLGNYMNHIDLLREVIMRELK